MYLTLQNQIILQETPTHSYFCTVNLCFENKLVSFLLPVKVGDDFDLILAALELQFK